MANEPLLNTTAVTLDWADVTSANGYHLQVCESPDFVGSMVSEDSSLVASTKTFTDAGTNNAKRYWRWRYTTDAGTTWSAWSEVGSYWLSTSFGSTVSLSDNQWALVNPSDVSDRYVLSVFPSYSVTKQLVNRLRTRNRRGTLLSDFITTKDMITLFITENSWIEHEQMREIYRFHNSVKTFFLITLKTNAVDVVPNAWKVQFQSDPALSMFAAGRPDLFVGDLALEEV